VTTYMSYKKYLACFIGLVLILGFAGISTGQYEGVIIDEQGDVSHYTSLDPFPKQVERPNVDILRVEMIGEAGTVTVSLTVAGEILEKQDDIEFTYEIWLLDQDSTLYWIQYDGNHCVLAIDGQDYDLEPNGIGSDTLSVTFSLAEIGEPAALDLRDAQTLKRFDDEEEVTHTYRDTATAEEEEGDFIPENYQLDVDPDSGSPTLQVTISISAENHGDADGEVPLIIDGEEHMTLEIPANDEASDAFAYYFFEEGQFEISFGDETVYVTVDESLEDDDNGEDDNGEDDNGEDDNGEDDNGEDDNGDDDAPGFALMVLAVSLVIAVLIHKKKNYYQ